MINIKLYDYFYHEPSTIQSMKVEEVASKYINQDLYNKSLTVLKQDSNEIPFELQSSAFEVMSDVVKIFFDIENYEYDNTDLIECMLVDFDKYVYGLTSPSVHVLESSYVLTENTNSRHTGMSYHIILPAYKVNMRDLDKLVKMFIEYSKSNNKVYYKFIDTCVYHSRRLFRLPLQHGIATRTNDSRRLSFKEWVDMYYINNYHKFIRITKIKYDYMITYTDTCKELVMNSLFESNKSYNKKTFNVFSNGAVNNTVNDYDEDINVRIISLMYDTSIDSKYSPLKKNLLTELNEYYLEHKTYNGFKGLSNKSVIKLFDRVFN